ncbi:hypothetical protein [Desulfitobacterium sp. AusDCA]|uniref:hypothetical protein n=1 Tax=Desulfitobacterium sp. AusDCA TaxID=3240383 RepID=UPI003DA7721C
MTTTSIKNLNLLKIYDKESQETYFGGDQEWYSKKWQRLSGCGPTAATNIFYYLSHSKDILKSAEQLNTKEGWISLMEKMWGYVTPSVRGVHTTKMFFEPMVNFAKAQGRNLEYYVYEVPEDPSQRPQFQEILKFIEKGLSKDVPVAFLNLNNGKVKNLDRWHWVTIISLEYIEEGQSAFLTILDYGRVKKIDLALWYNSTTLGGGFVYFLEKY